jgi:triacylglycerol lipase
MSIAKLQAPIVLIHGFCGFDEVRLGRWTLASYFPRIPALLRAAGNRILIPRLSPTRSVAERAAQLKDFLDREAPRQPVHLFAHSMGGLDARYAVSRLGLADRVLTMTTLGTPHRGTTFADWGIRRLERLVKPVLQLLGVPTGGFYDLTTAGAARLNEQMPDVPGIRYFSVAGRYAGGFAPEWLLPHAIVSQEEGANDGIVSVASARYGEALDVWEGDHLSLVNWVRALKRSCGRWQDRAPLYAHLVNRLSAEGY